MEGTARGRVECTRGVGENVAVHHKMKRRREWRDEGNIISFHGISHHRSFASRKKMSHSVCSFGELVSEREGILPAA